MTRIGIIGTGNISGTHARASRAAGVEVAAVCGRDPARTRAFADQHGASPYVDIAAFLKHPGLDLVAIGTPSAMHAVYGIAAARCGLHVLVEKPIDISVRRADELIDACAAAQVKLGVFFQERFSPGVVEMKRLIDTGAIGRPILVAAQLRWCRPATYYTSSTWRGTSDLDGGGVVINQGIHTLDALLHLLGPAIGVHMRTATALHTIATEDTAVATLEFANGALGTFECTTAAHPGFPRRIEITGTEGTAIIEGDKLASLSLRTATTVAETGGQQAPAATGQAVIANVSGHSLVIEDFLAAIANDGTPRCDGREGRRSIALVEALYASARSRCAVEIPERPSPLAYAAEAKAG